MDDLEHEIAKLEARRARLLDEIALSGALISSGARFALGRALLCAPGEQFQEALAVLATSLGPRRQAQLRDFLDAACSTGRAGPLPTSNPKTEETGRGQSAFPVSHEDSGKSANSVVLSSPVANPRPPTHSDPLHHPASARS